MTIESQLVESLEGKVIIRSGKQILEKTTNGYCVTDGWLSDWIIFYDHKPEWANDGVLKFNKAIVTELNKLANN